jgi:gluconate 2-dehydrogenase gamma chain
MIPRRYTRRQVLDTAGRAGAVTAIGIAAGPRLRGLARLASNQPLDSRQLRTLQAAVARIVPAERPGDWSAADVGADEYIVTLLSGVDRIYAGGPFRSRFAAFQQLSRVKRIGWSGEIKRLRKVYRAGLEALDRLAGGDFASAPGPLQDLILTALDDAGSDFFTALVNHVMEGVYAHPVYGGNRNYVAWRTMGYAGDVHGVRFPGIGPPDAPWNVYGGYAPQEMAEPGKEPT